MSFTCGVEWCPVQCCFSPTLPDFLDRQMSVGSRPAAVLVWVVFQCCVLWDLCDFEVCFCVLKSKLPLICILVNLLDYFVPLWPNYYLFLYYGSVIIIRSSLAVGTYSRLFNVFFKVILINYYIAFWAFLSYKCIFYTNRIKIELFVSFKRCIEVCFPRLWMFDN